MISKRCCHLFTAVLLAIAALPSNAGAHDKWLEAEPFFSSAPATTKIYLLTGDALRQPEALPIRQRSRMAHFALLTASGKRELLPMLREDQQPIASLPAGTLPQGTSMLLLDTAPVDILLTAEKFQAYLFEEGLIDILMERAEHREEDTPGRERYSRSLKAVVQSGSKFDDSVTKPAGQELEIVPLVNPYLIPVGGKLIVQILFRGQPLAKRAVTFANRFHSNVVSKTIRTDKHGQASFSVERTGQWLVSLVHMERSHDPMSEWRSYWSSMTFELREATP